MRAGLWPAACLLALSVLVGRLQTVTAAIHTGDDDAVVAARKSVADSFPFAALVASEKMPLCTGSLVAPRAVLTAASCVDDREQRPEVVFVGLFNAYLDPFRRPGSYEILRVQEVRLFPNYSSRGSPHHNLALLVLRERSRKPPVEVPGAVFGYPTNAQATALGFGGLTADGVWPQLHADAVTMLPGDDCAGLQVAYGPPASDGLMRHACTGVSSSFRACATGNVGAPLLMPEAGSGAYLQLGLLTSGFGCSSSSVVPSASSPALFTWLPRYAHWLSEQLASL